MNYSSTIEKKQFHMYQYETTFKIFKLKKQGAEYLLLFA